MAYGLKYTIPFKDIDNNTNLVEIYQDGFVGSSTELIATDAPAVHKYEREDNEDILSPIMSSTLTISFYSTDTTDFTNFFSYSDREFYVVHKFDGQIVFKGYLLNDIVGEPFQDPPYPVVLTATDALAQLKEFAMTGPSVDTDLGTLFFNQLNSLNLEMDFEVCNDLYEGLVMDNTKSIFSQDEDENLLVQAGTFEALGLNAFQFLEEVCRTFGWVLFQSNNRWVIQRPISRNIDTTTIYIHDWDTFEIKESFTSSTINSLEQWYLKSIANSTYWSSIYANGKFYAVSRESGFITVSTDGLTWTTIATTSSGLYDIIYANNKFVAVGFKLVSGNYDTSVQVSIDGITWTEYNPSTKVLLLSITYGNGKFVAVGDGASGFVENTVITSTDGINWTLSVTSGVYGLEKIAYGNGKYVAVSSLISGGNNKIFYSSDGLTWNNQTFIYNNETILFANNKFTVGNAYSTDGINWTAATYPGTLEPNGLVYGNGIYVGVGIFESGDAIAISTDAINWDLIKGPTIGNWRTVTFGDNKFISLRIASDQNLMISYLGEDPILETVADQTKANTDWVPVNSDQLLAYQRPIKKLTLTQGDLGQSIIANGEDFNENSWTLDAYYRPNNWTINIDPDNIPQVFPANIPSQASWDDEKGVNWDFRLISTTFTIESDPIFLDNAGLIIDFESQVTFKNLPGVAVFYFKHTDVNNNVKYLTTEAIVGKQVLTWSSSREPFVFNQLITQYALTCKVKSFILPAPGFLQVEIHAGGTFLFPNELTVSNVKLTPTYLGEKNPSEVKKVYQTTRAYTTVREDNLVFSDLCIAASKNWFKIGGLPAIVFVEKSLASTPGIIQVPSGAVTQVNRLTDTLGLNTVTFSGGVLNGQYQRQYVAASGFTISSAVLSVTSPNGTPPFGTEILPVMSIISTTQRNFTVTFNNYDFTGGTDVQIIVTLKDANNNTYQVSTFLFEVTIDFQRIYSQTDISFEAQSTESSYSPTLRDCYARNVLTIYNALSYRLEGSFRRKGNDFGYGFVTTELDYSGYTTVRMQIIGWEYDLASRVARIIFGQVPTAYVYPIN
jgi:hypothetical protein